MKSYIANLLPRLKEYSARLDNLALLTNHPWIQIDESGDRTVFVFRDKENELLISKNGNVSTCSWEYLDYMNSLVIEVNEESTLYNQGFLDETVMILSKDGQSEYLLLANENKVEERDAEKILANLNRKYLMAGEQNRPHVSESKAAFEIEQPKREEGPSLPRLFGVVGLVAWILGMVYEAGPGSSGPPPEGFEMILYIAFVLVGGAVCYSIAWGLARLFVGGGNQASEKNRN